MVGRVGEATLADQAGEVTSHLSGLFYRTTRMLEAGMRPIYVFDGEPPTHPAARCSLAAPGRPQAACSRRRAWLGRP
jgi:flap endonuclease-1